MILTHFHDYISGTHATEYLFSININSDAPPKHWPSDGAIKFSNVSMSYDETTTGSQVLKNLNFEIRGNEKIGIVGR